MAQGVSMTSLFFLLFCCPASHHIHFLSNLWEPTKEANWETAGDRKDLQGVHKKNQLQSIQSPPRHTTRHYGQIIHARTGHFCWRSRSSHRIPRFPGHQRKNPTQAVFWFLRIGCTFPALDILSNTKSNAILLNLKQLERKDQGILCQGDQGDQG